MIFSSYMFIGVFLPIVLIVYYVLLKYSQSISQYFILGSSFVFYMSWNPPYIMLLVFSILFNYAVGSALLRYSERIHGRRFLFVLGIFVNVGLIAYYKYANFIAENVNSIASVGIGSMDIILPLAISFFTFQQIMFLCDVRSGKISDVRFFHYALYIAFFPQLIAGPIVHYRELVPQFLYRNVRRFVSVNLAVGLAIFAIGLFKKVVLADTIGVLSDQFYATVALQESYTIWEAWMGALAYSLQIYFDFSGYSDMAIGLARMFGYKLPLNFFSPYRAKSIIEFWRRWHITLSRFLRDYVYIPLGGNQKGPLVRYANLLITMLVGGLWHGASWNFVIWGGIHGVLLIINHLWRMLLSSLGLSFKIPTIVAVPVTFLCVTVAWVFFRVESFDDAMLMISVMSGAHGVVLPLWMADATGAFGTTLADAGVRFETLQHFGGRFPLLMLLGGMAIVWFAPNTIQFVRKYRPVLPSDFRDLIYRPLETGSFWFWPLRFVVWRPNVRNGLAIAVLLAVALMFMIPGNARQFVYFQF
jgi:alginate O-acetyltransferase complex protein AlgI